MSGVGTLAKGGFSSVTQRTVWNFQSPAGRTKTLITQQEPSQSAEIERNPVHGAGAVGPVFIAKGHGTLEWSTEIAKHEWAEIERTYAGAAGLAIDQLLFDQVITNTLTGIPKDSDRVIGCSISSVEKSTAGDGSMVALSGQALNAFSNGAWLFEPRK